MPRRSLRSNRRSHVSNEGLAFLAFLIGIVLFVLFSLLTAWHPYVVWLSAWGVTSLLLYAFDKARARKRKWRVPELVFHGLALVGGFLGGWAGMFLFRHKLRTPEIVTTLIISTIVHGVLFYLLLLR